MKEVPSSMWGRVGLRADHSGSGWKGTLRIVILIGMLWLNVFVSWDHGNAREMSRAEIWRIRFEAERTLEHIVELWKDKRFVELYTYGTFASQIDLSPEAFAYHMQRGLRTLQCCWDTIQNVESRFETTDRVYVTARIGFKNKEFLVVRGQHRFIARLFLEQETLTFLLLKEEQKWRVDLFRILALSGASLELPGAIFSFRHLH